MKSSIRRIASTLLFMSVLSLGLGTLSSFVSECGTGTSGCLASVLSFSNISTQSTPDFSTVGSTASYRGDPATDTAWLMELIRAMSVAGLFVAVTILIILECFELYYIRTLLHARKKLRLW